jgi:phage-related minor tail protein
VPSLEDEREALSTALAEAAGRPAAADLARSRDAVSARIAAAERQRDARDALLAKMQATVTEFEQARDELAELIAGTATPMTTNDDAAAQLTSRLDALREGLVEVRQAANPEIRPSGQG